MLHVGVYILLLTYPLVHVSIFQYFFTFRAGKLSLPICCAFWVRIDVGRKTTTLHRVCLPNRLKLIHESTEGSDEGRREQGRFTHIIVKKSKDGWRLTRAHTHTHAQQEKGQRQRTTLLIYPVTFQLITRACIYPLSAWIMQGQDWYYVNMWIVIGMKECFWLDVARHCTTRIKFIECFWWDLSDSWYKNSTV